MLTRSNIIIIIPKLTLFAKLKKICSPLCVFKINGASYKCLKHSKNFKFIMHKAQVQEEPFHPEFWCVIQFALFFVTRHNNK